MHEQKAGAHRVELVCCLVFIWCTAFCTLPAAWHVMNILHGTNFTPATTSGLQCSFDLEVLLMFRGSNTQFAIQVSSVDECRDNIFIGMLSHSVPCSTACLMIDTSCCDFSSVPLKNEWDFWMTLPPCLPVFISFSIGSMGLSTASQSSPPPGSTAPSPVTHLFSFQFLFIHVFPPSARDVMYSKHAWC